MSRIKLLVSFAAFIFSFVFFAEAASAQWTGVQYGPRAFANAPPGTQALSVTYDRTSIDLGVNPASGSSINTTSEALYNSYVGYFDLNGKSASLLVSIPFVSIESTITTGCCGTFDGLSTEGMTDPFVQFNYPLIGGDSLSPQEFFTTEPGFAMTLHTGMRIPIGEYNSDTPLNPGTNRFEFRLGLPVSYKWGTPTKQTTLELTPVVYFFEDNDDPFGAGRVEQDQAYQLEAHLTHDFSPAVWGALNMIYVWGGETTTDGIAGNNDFDYWGGSVSLGMRLSRSLSATASYGIPLDLQSDDNDGSQFKFGITYTF